MIFTWWGKEQERNERSFQPQKIVAMASCGVIFDAKLNKKNKIENFKERDQERRENAISSKKQSQEEKT